MSDWAIDRSFMEFWTALNNELSKHGLALARYSDVHRAYTQNVSVETYVDKERRAS